MKRAIAVAALALLGIGTWLWWSSDRRRIERRLDALVAACEKSGAESPLDLLAGTQAILGAFAPGMLVRAEPYGGSFTDARELARLIQGYRAAANRIEIVAGDRALAIGDNRTAEMTTLFRIAGDAGGGPGIESFRARIFWVAVDGDWKIREFEVVERIESSGLFR